MKKSFRPRVEEMEGRDLPSPTATVLSSSANPSPRGRPVTITARVLGGDFLAGSIPGVTSSLAGAGETVDFIVNNRLRAVEPVSDGVAAFTFIPRPGRNVISATYSGGFWTSGPPGVGVILGADDVSGSGPVGLVEICLRGATRRHR